MTNRIPEARIKELLDIPWPATSHGSNYKAALAQVVKERDKLRETVEQIIDFHNAPVQVKRPDIFHRLIVQLNRTLEGGDDD